MEWAVSITTAPRELPTLERCVESVLKAGWYPTVFAEPGTDTKDLQVPVIQNKEKLGVWHNWRQTALWAVEQGLPFLSIQDDILFHPETRQLVEQVCWPRECGVISLYTPRHFQQWVDGSPRPFGFYEIDAPCLYGACALCIPHDVLKKIVDHPKFHNWLGIPPEDYSNAPSVWNNRKANPHTIANSDNAIGIIIRRLNKRMMFFNPSPTHHISRYSACGHGSNNNKLKNRNAVYIAHPRIPIAEQIDVSSYVSGSVKS